MQSIHFDPQYTDETRRISLQQGSIQVYSLRESTRALSQFAQELTQEAFSAVGLEPEKAQSNLPVEEFVSIIGPLKSRFTNDSHTKKLVQDVLESFGCDLEKTFFDVPRLRIVTHGGYLASGVGYAYLPHRDTWYSSPSCQLNWWSPLYDLTAERALEFYPSYWNRPIANSSGSFNYDEWLRVGRTQAQSQIKADSRNHPLPLEEVEDPGLRVVCPAGSTILFSGAHLHATAPNTSALTRFSLDFRTIHLDDILANQGAPETDNASQGSTLGDFLRASDFAPLSRQLTPQR